MEEDDNAGPKVSSTHLSIDIIRPKKTLDQWQAYSTTGIDSVISKRNRLIR